jgi:tRNA A-37 threonylcarbamoyl transferase component Bud32
VQSSQPPSTTSAAAAAAAGSAGDAGDPRPAPAPAPVTGPGTVLSGRYRLEAAIAAGGSSAVWRATDERLGRAVAVKLMRDELLADPAARERFEREARVVACLESPNIVDVYDVGLDDQRRYLVMELIDGESLAGRLRREGALDPAIAVAVADRVLAALEVAHAEGTVHRDVKPANVLLPTGGGVKLADFGIAKALEAEAASLTAAGQVLGTPAYLSPEQVAGRPAGPASDVYAVGVLLHEMIAGRPPFEGSDPLSAALARQQQDPPRLDGACPGLAPAIADVVERALCRDPSGRFADAGEMRAALSAATPRVEQPEPAPVTAGPAVGPAGRASGPDDPTVAVAAVPDGPDDPTVVVAAVPDGPDDPTVVVADVPDGPIDATVVAAPSPLVEPVDEPTLAAPAPGPGDAAPVRTAATRRAAWLAGAAVALLVVVALVLGGGGELPTAEDLATDEATAGGAGAPDAAVPPPASAGTIPELEELVRAHPDRWGPRSPDLADRLAAVAGAEGPAQGEQARTLLAELDAWEAAGELDSEVAARTRELVGPLAMVVEEPPAPEEGRGEGRGRGRGRDRDDD